MTSNDRELNESFKELPKARQHFCHCHGMKSFRVLEHQYCSDGYRLLTCAVDLIDRVPRGTILATGFT